jgi:hypothetical protein
MTDEHKRVAVSSCISNLIRLIADIPTGSDTRAYICETVLPALGIINSKSGGSSVAIDKGSLARVLERSANLIAGSSPEQAHVLMEARRLALSAVDKTRF